MARLDEILEVDNNPVPAKEPFQGLAEAADAAASGFLDLSTWMAEIDFSADSFKIEWDASGIYDVSDSLNTTLRFSPLASGSSFSTGWIPLVNISA